MGTRPLLPEHIVGGSGCLEAPGPPEILYKVTPVGGDPDSTANWTVLERTETRCVPTSHSAEAVFMMTGCAFSASAGKLATGDNIPVASITAIVTKCLANIFMATVGGAKANLHTAPIILS